MRIYISGQITGLDIKVAEEYFEQIENKLRDAGHVPINPMKVVEYHPDHKYEHYMAEDLKALCHCDAIFMLENWQNSRGAKIEHGVALGMEKMIFYSKNHNLFSKAE